MPAAFGQRHRMEHREGSATVINAGTADDVVYLALTFILAAVVTVAFLIEGRTDSSRR